MAEIKTSHVIISFFKSISLCIVVNNICLFDTTILTFAITILENLLVFCTMLPRTDEI